MKKRKRNKVLTFLLFVQIGIVYLLSFFPNSIEKYYSNSIYPHISSNLRTLFGKLPFSVGDLLYSFLIVFLIRLLVITFRRKFRNVSHLLYQMGAIVSITYFCFYFFWALNYSRPSVLENLKLSSTDYDHHKLEQLSDKLLNHLILIHGQLTPHDTVAVVVPYSTDDIFRMTTQGYKNLSEKFSQFSYQPSSIKKSIYSLPLTYMGFAGYLNPLTGEAQVDWLIPKSSMPMTTSHEVAHQLGIASESEANFIGFLAASFHDDPYFQYSAYMSAFRYTLYDIYNYDTLLYQEYIARMPLGIKKNIAENQEFWKKYDNPLEPLFKSFYDGYLKANQQEDGILSYNQMVSFLIAYDSKYPL